jgi:hypothetical protein
MNASPSFISLSRFAILFSDKRKLPRKAFLHEEIYQAANLYLQNQKNAWPKPSARMKKSAEIPPRPEEAKEM